MKRIEIEQSLKAFSSGHWGLLLVGHLINHSTDLCQRLEKEVPGRPVISHADVVKTYVGLLCLGKSDFEAAEGVVGDDWFKEALDIQKVPSQETLRQRFDKHARVVGGLAAHSKRGTKTGRMTECVALFSVFSSRSAGVRRRNTRTGRFGLSCRNQEMEKRPMRGISATPEEVPPLRGRCHGNSPAQRGFGKQLFPGRTQP